MSHVESSHAQLEVERQVGGDAHVLTVGRRLLLRVVRRDRHVVCRDRVQSSHDQVGVVHCLHLNKPVSTGLYSAVSKLPND